MTSPDVRAAVEAAIRRHLDARRSAPVAGDPRASAAPAPNGPSRHPAGGRVERSPEPSAAPASNGPSRHPAGGRVERSPEPSAAPASNGPSHARFDRAVLAGDPRDGRCVIEPSVECIGSGTCRSLGH